MYEHESTAQDGPAHRLLPPRPAPSVLEPACRLHSLCPHARGPAFSSKERWRYWPSFGLRNPPTRDSPCRRCLFHQDLGPRCLVCQKLSGHRACHAWFRLRAASSPRAALVRLPLPGPSVLPSKEHDVCNLMPTRGFSKELCPLKREAIIALVQDRGWTRIGEEHES